jgi:adenylate cyclase
MVALAAARQATLAPWLAAAAIACLGMALAHTAPAQRLQQGWLDASFRMLRSYYPRPATAEVVIVGVDQASITASGKPFALMLDELAMALDGLRLGTARAVGVDLLLPAADFEALAPGAAQRLALAIGRLRSAAPLVLGRAAAADQPAGAGSALYAAMAGIEGQGLLLVPADRDGRLRRIDDTLGAGSAALLLAPRLAARLGAAPATGIVDFSIGRPFDYLPLCELVALARSGDAAALRARFAGKVVLLGAVLADQDRQTIPVALANWETGESVPGVVFQAQALRTLLQQRMIDSRPGLADAAALLAVALLWSARRRLRRAAVLAVALAALAAGASLALLAHGVEVPLPASLCALVLGCAWLVACAYRRQLAEQRRVRAIFSGYVSPAILDTILSGALKDGLVGKRQALAFLFADVRGFTAYCAAHPPEQVIAFLNRYYGVITPALHRYGGTIDKFSGDGIMVFFGAPQPSPNPARDAVLAALALLDALAGWNAELARSGEPAVRVGIGIAFGDAVLGNVGSALRHDYTATGAAATLAAHIQQYCKKVPHALLVQQEAYELAQLPAAQRARFKPVAAALEKHGDVMLAALDSDGEGNG